MGHEVLAVVLRVAVAAPRCGVEAHAVVEIGLLIAHVGIRIAAPVPQVDEDVGALSRDRHRAPGRVRRVHLDDVARVLCELGRGGVRLGSVGGR